MVETRFKGVLVGVLMLAAGLGYLYITTNLPRRGAVDASFFPYMLAILMAGLGLLQLLVSLRQPAEAARDSEEASPTGAPSYGTVFATLALVAAFTALLRPLGFPIAAAIYLFLQFIVLTPSGRRASHPLYAVLAVVCSVVIFVAFRYGFELLLPGGPLTQYLP